MNGEKGFGLLPNAPIIFGILPFLAFAVRINDDARRTYVLSFLCLLLLPASINVGVLLIFSAAAIRYTVDFLPFLLLTACLGWLMLEERFHHSTVIRRTVQGAFIILFLVSAACNVGISLTGDHNTFLSRNPNLFKKIENWFAPVSARYHLKNLGKYGGIQLNLRFPLKNAGQEILTMAQTWTGVDVVFFRYVDQGKLQIGIQHAGRMAISPPLEVNLHRDHKMIIEMGSLYPKPTPALLARGYDPEKYRRVRIVLDNVVVLSGAADFQESHPSNVLIGKKGAKRKSRLPWFSGQIISSARLPPL